MLLVPDKQEAAGSCSQFYAIQIYVSTTSAARKKNVIEKDECFSPLPLVCSCAADSCEVQLLHIKHTPTLVHTHTHSLRLRAAATGAARSLTHLGELSAAIQLTGRHMQTLFKASIHLLSYHLIPRLHTHTHS